MGMTKGQREDAYTLCDEIIELAESIRERVDGWDDLEDTEDRDEAAAEIVGWLEDISNKGEDAQKLSDRVNL